MSHSGAMIEVGTRVQAKSVAFGGLVLGRHEHSGVGGARAFWSLPSEPNVVVCAVLNEETGEVRFFNIEALDVAEAA